MRKLCSRLGTYGYRILLAAGLLLGLYRLRYFTYAPVPLGYDPGMYKEIFSSYVEVLRHMDLSYLPSRVRHEPLLGIVAALLLKIGVSSDRLVTRGIGILNLIPGFLIFWLFRSRKTPRIGSVVALLYRTSLVQYEVFRWNYFKQIIGVSLMLLIIILGEKKKSISQSILFFLLILLHRHTAVFTGIILGGSAIMERIQKRSFPWRKILYRCSAGLLALLCYIPLRGRVMPEAIKAVSTSLGTGGMGGAFMTISSYIALQWIVIILSLIGIIMQIKKKKMDVRMLGYSVSIIRILAGLVNFNRTIVFLDIFVLYFAAIALGEIFIPGKQTSLKIIGTSIVGMLLVRNSRHYLSYVEGRSIALISDEEFSSLNSLDEILEKNAIVMVTHRNYAPWIMGWSRRSYITPGMSDLDRRTHANWNQRWMNDGKIKCDMLQQTYQSMQRPFYIRLGSQQFTENLSGGACFHPYAKGTTRRLYRIF